MISSCIAMGYVMCPHLWENSLRRTSVKKTAEILVSGAICKLCCCYFTVETAVGREIGNFPGIWNAAKIFLSFSRHFARNNQ